MRTLIVAALLAMPACAADVDAPADSPPQPAPAVRQTVQEQTILADALVEVTAQYQTMLSDADARHEVAMDAVARANATYQVIVIIVAALVTVLAIAMPVSIYVINVTAIRHRQEEVHKMQDDLIMTKADLIEQKLAAADSLSGLQQDVEKQSQLVAGAQEDLERTKVALKKSAADSHTQLLTQGMTMAWTFFQVLVRFGDEEDAAIRYGSAAIVHCEPLEMPADEVGRLVEQYAKFLLRVDSRRALAESAESRKHVQEVIEMLDRRYKGTSMDEWTNTVRKLLAVAQPEEE